MTDRKEEQFGKAEAKSRFEAALRGAREAGHKTYEKSKVGRAKPKPNSKPQPAKAKG